MQLQHRTAMAPLTRFRALDCHTPSEMMIEYYKQRASIPGTLLITEGTFISPRAGGYANVPGIYTEKHKAAWRKVTTAVHEKGSYIFCQLWSLGRTADPSVALDEGIEILGPSPIAVDQNARAPRQMSRGEIQAAIEDYVQAARNAIEAGFDGVELHGANGYIIDQFLQSNSNQRSDEYGGSIENRSRFGIEAVQMVVNAVGASKTAIRLSPWSTFNGMKMDGIIPQFQHFVKSLDPLGLAYLHLVESRIAGNEDVESDEKLDFAVQSWSGPKLIAGGFTPNSAHALVNEQRPHDDVVVVFGRSFLSNPDLPFRLSQGLQLNAYDRSTFYTPKGAKGYADYPFSDEFLEPERGQKL